MGFLAASPLRASRRASAAQAATSILFTNVRVFDGLSSSLRQGLDALVTGNTWTQNRQLSKLSRWFDTSEVLKLATSRTGDLLAMSDGRNPYPGRLGVIEAGAFADLLVIDGNSLEDISLVADPDRTMKPIMKDGVIYKDELAA